MEGVSATLPIARKLFRPGQRVCIAVSGGADSVALLRTLHTARAALGLVLSVVHVHHGIRGVEADGDADFVRQLSAELGLPCEVLAGEAKVRAAECGETLEEAARNIRYRLFAQELELGRVDVVATAHTLDDQAETVLMKLLRGAWTEGLGGIHPVVIYARGAVVRPMLQVSRSAVETYLRELGQAWREDASNQDPAFTRNRIRHELLPALRGYNPQIAGQLARLAAIARDEEAWWAGELGRMLPQLLLPGRPVRGGGRSTSTHPEDASVSLELERLRGLQPAVRRRVLRAAAQGLGLSLDFDEVERLLRLAGADGEEEQAARGRGSSRNSVNLPGGWIAERTPRELQIRRLQPKEPSADGVLEYRIPVPGSVEGRAFGVVVRAAEAGNWEGGTLILRAWRAGDRVTVCHSRGPKKVKEVLERLKVTGRERQGWPVVALEGPQTADQDAQAQANVVWMRGVPAEPFPGLQLRVEERSFGEK
jgi:tRNA(Ile)-lysidine synthase